MAKSDKNTEYQKLIREIGKTYQTAKINSVNAINIQMLHAYWRIGKNIIEYEQVGKLKADYGKKLILNLSKDLSTTHGRGFSRTNLAYMRLLYNKYPTCEELSSKLSWSHYFELLKVDLSTGQNYI